jgi:hypothetical protein
MILKHSNVNVPHIEPNDEWIATQQAMLFAMQLELKI